MGAIRLRAELYDKNEGELSNALSRASLEGNAELIEELAKALTGSAEVAQTFVAPNPAGGFRGYVLLRLSRSAAAFTARSIFVRSGARYDNKFLDTIKSEPKE